MFWIKNTLCCTKTNILTHFKEILKQIHLLESIRQLLHNCGSIDFHCFTMKHVNTPKWNP